MDNTEKKELDAGSCSAEISDFPCHVAIGSVMDAKQVLQWGIN